MFLHDLVIPMRFITYGGFFMYPRSIYYNGVDYSLHERKHINTFSTTW